MKCHSTSSVFLLIFRSLVMLSVRWSFIEFSVAVAFYAEQGWWFLCYNPYVSQQHCLFEDAGLRIDEWNHEVGEVDSCRQFVFFDIICAPNSRIYIWGWFDVSCCCSFFSLNDLNFIGMFAFPPPIRVRWNSWFFHVPSLDFCFHGTWPVRFTSRCALPRSANAFEFCLPSGRKLNKEPRLDVQLLFAAWELRSWGDL